MDSVVEKQRYVSQADFAKERQRLVGAFDAWRYPVLEASVEERRRSRRRLKKAAARAVSRIHLLQPGHRPDMTGLLDEIEKALTDRGYASFREIPDGFVRDPAAVLPVEPDSPSRRRLPSWLKDQKVTGDRKLVEAIKEGSYKWSFLKTLAWEGVYTDARVIMRASPGMVGVSRSRLAERAPKEEAQRLVIENFPEFDQDESTRLIAADFLADRGFLDESEQLREGGVTSVDRMVPWREIFERYGAGDRPAEYAGRMVNPGFEHQAVRFDCGGESVLVDPSYLAVFYARYDNVTVHGSLHKPQQQPVLIRSNGELVGAVMPLHPKGFVEA